MKIAILTFHSQLNYGGVLQCWALQEAITKLGHDVKVLDRWLDPKNETLNGNRVSGIKSLIIRILDIVKMNGFFATGRRIRKTKRFIASNINLTNYHFYTWKGAPKELDFDVVVVGSDQVWNSFGTKDPSVYLLKGAPPVKAISYAASLGMIEIPEHKRYLYAEGLKRFSRISVREKSAIRLIEKFASLVDKVSDPVVLLDQKDWNKVSSECVERRKKCLFCYFIAENIAEYYEAFSRFAKTTKADVEIYLSSTSEMRGLSCIDKIRSLMGGSVRLRIDGAPSDFLSSIRSADWVLTDSFHAAMFSAIFNKNVRVLRPKSEVRIAMFDRIKELSELLDEPFDFVSHDINSALASFINGYGTCFSQKKLARLRNYSLDWLNRALIQED